MTDAVTPRNTSGARLRNIKIRINPGDYNILFEDVLYASDTVRTLKTLVHEHTSAAAAAAGAAAVTAGGGQNLFLTPVKEKQAVEGMAAPTPTAGTAAVGGAVPDPSANATATSADVNMSATLSALAGPGETHDCTVLEGGGSSTPPLLTSGTHTPPLQMSPGVLNTSSNNRPVPVCTAGRQRVMFLGRELKDQEVYKCYVGVWLWIDYMCILL